MAKIWYAREGNSPTPQGSRYEGPLTGLLGLSDKFPGNYLGEDTPRFTSSNPKLDSFRSPQFVILEVTNEDLSGVQAGFGFRPKLKQGFYRVPITVQECEELLQKCKA